MTRSFPAAPHLSAHALTREVAFMNRTIIRYCRSAALPCAANPIRGEGQTRNEDERYLELQINREFAFGGQRVEAGVGIYNVFNNGAQEQWNIGANQIYSPNYLSRFNRTAPRQMP